jgi:hypothetical protein
MSDDKFSLQRVSGIPWDVFVRLVRTRFDGNTTDLNKFLEPYGQHPVVDGILNTWDLTPVYTPSDSTRPEFKTLPYKRLLFWAVRPEKFFPTCDPTLLAEYSDEVVEPVWDRDGVESSRVRTRKYAVYSVEADAIGSNPDGMSDHRVGVLQCWCPSTGKEHWIMVPSDAVRPRYGTEQNTPKEIVNSALAYVFFGVVARWSGSSLQAMLSGKAIYRQGDVIFRREDPSMPRYENPHSLYGSTIIPDVLSHLKAEA